MTFDELIRQLVNDTTQKSLGHFSPELALCVTIVGMLIVRIAGGSRSIPACWLATIGSVAALGFALYQFRMMGEPGSAGSETFFTGLLIYDKFTIFFRLFLLLFLVLVIVLTMLSGIPDYEDGPDFYSLLLGSTIGMMLMASANHLLILFVGIEMTSVPSYVMVGFLKGRRQSSEAALKYVVYGAGAAGVMLYGISLLAGLLGTGDLPAIATQLQAVFGSSGETGPEATGMANATVRTLALAIMLVLVGLAFKLSLVPFHFWCPDAFEGAPAEVAGFLSVASKAGAFALLVRFVLQFTGADLGGAAQIPLVLGIGLGVVDSISATYGNLAAYAQTNVKRLLAYSTIAHAGYMLMAVSAMMVILSQAGASNDTARFEAIGCVEGLLYYLTVYFFMNLGAFAIVALIRNEILSEEIEDYRGLVQQTPVLCVCMLFCMFSLVGIPPFGGFFGKMAIFKSLVAAAEVHWFMWVVLSLGGLNTVLSLFYYLRVLKTMFIDERPAGAREVRIPLGSDAGLYVLVVSAPVLLLGLLIGGLSNIASNVASVLFP